MYGLTRWIKIVFLISGMDCGVTHAQQSDPKKHVMIKVAKDEYVHKVLFSPIDDTLSYLSTEPSIATWDVKAKKEGTLFHKLESLIVDFDYSPDGKALAIAAYPKLYSLDIKSGALTVLSKQLSTNHVRFSPDGKWIITDQHCAITIWDVANKIENREINFAKDGHVREIIMIPSSDSVVAVVENAEAALNFAPKPNYLRPKVLSWEVIHIASKTGKVKTILTTIGPGNSGALAASRDGRHFAFADGEKILVGSTATWKMEEIPNCPIDPTICLFSNNARYVFAGGSTKDVPTSNGKAHGEIAIFDQESKKWVRHLEVLSREVDSITLSHKNDLLAVSSNKLGTIELYDVSPITLNPMPEK